MELQAQGKNFLYILPSREAIRAVRYEILDRNKGMLNSRVIMFDELEAEIAENFLNKKNAIKGNENKWNANKSTENKNNSNESSTNESNTNKKPCDWND